MTILCLEFNLEKWVLFRIYNESEKPRFIGSLLYSNSTQIPQFSMCNWCFTKHNNISHFQIMIFSILLLHSIPQFQTCNWCFAKHNNINTFTLRSSHTLNLLKYYNSQHVIGVFPSHIALTLSPLDLSFTLNSTQTPQFSTGNQCFAETQFILRKESKTTWKMYNTFISSIP